MNHMGGKKVAAKSKRPDLTGPNREAWCLKFDDIDCVDLSLVKHQDFKTRQSLE